MPEHNYGKRLCLQCGKEFEARHPSHITCSPECSIARRFIQKRQREARYRDRRKKYLLDLLAERDTAYSDLEWLNCHLEEGYKAHSKALRALAITHANNVAEIEAELKKVREERDAYRAAAEKRGAKPETTAAPKPPDLLPALKDCPRMHLRATTLPCGEREECYTPLCERLGGVTASGPAPGKRICPVCKKPFTPKSPPQKFCSAECRKAKKQV